MTLYVRALLKVAAQDYHFKGRDLCNRAFTILQKKDWPMPARRVAALAVGAASVVVSLGLTGLTLWAATSGPALVLQGSAMSLFMGAGFILSPLLVVPMATGVFFQGLKTIKRAFEPRADFEVHADQSALPSADYVIDKLVTPKGFFAPRTPQRTNRLSEDWQKKDDPNRYNPIVPLPGTWYDAEANTYRLHEPDPSLDNKSPKL